MDEKKKETLEELIEQAPDEKTEEVEIKEEIEETREKRKRKKLITAIFLAVVLIIAGGYVAWLVFQADKDLKEEKPVDEVVVEEEESEEPAVEKNYYVNADGGLNLRQEPSTTAALLATIPFGTKLTVLESKDGWHKTEYQGKTGWVFAEFVSQKNPLVYENTDYGFSLTFPTSWSGYKIFKKTDTDGSVALYVAIPTTDATWKEGDPIEAGYASLFALSVMTPATWEAVKNADGPKPAYLGENKGYVVAWSSGQATPTDLSLRFPEIKSIIDTFLLIK